MYKTCPASLLRIVEGNVDHSCKQCVEMIERSRSIDITRFQRASDLDDLEFLHATFIRHSFPRHTHDTFAIGVIERGVQATYCKGSTHIATSSDICLVNPGEVHTGFSPGESGWTYRVFYPDAALLSRVAGELSPRSPELPYFPSPVIKDRRLASHIFSFLKALEDSNVSLERESLLLSVVAQMIQRHGGTKENKLAGRQDGGRAVKTALEYLDAYFADNVTLSELSDMANMSEFHLLRLFRAAVGLPPHAYLIQKRIDYARSLLSQGLPIVQAGLESGFVDQSHFTRWFKKIVGITPGQYRRKSNSIQESN
jgi:AraC-like DNA-binding protein